MITLLTILVAIGSIMLMTLILIQDPKNGSLDSTYSKSEFITVINKGKSSILLERLTWSLASALCLLCIITTVIS